MFVSIKIILWLLELTYIYVFKFSGSNPQWEIVTVYPRQLLESYIKCFLSLTKTCLQVY